MERKADILVYEVLMPRRPWSARVCSSSDLKAHLLDLWVTIAVSKHKVFDAGLIGEGVLHALAAARLKLVLPDAVLVPASATVTARLPAVQIAGWCMPVCLGCFMWV